MSEYKDEIIIKNLKSLSKALCNGFYYDTGVARIGEYMLSGCSWITSLINCMDWMGVY